MSTDSVFLLAGRSTVIALKRVTLSDFPPPLFERWVHTWGEGDKRSVRKVSKKTVGRDSFFFPVQTNINNVGKQRLAATDERWMDTHTHAIAGRSENDRWPSPFFLSLLSLYILITTTTTTATTGKKEQ